jgi:hypothetical protein
LDDLSEAGIDGEIRSKAEERPAMTLGELAVLLYRARRGRARLDVQTNEAVNHWMLDPEMSCCGSQVIRRKRKRVKVMSG